MSSYRYYYRVVTLFEILKRVNITRVCMCHPSVMCGGHGWWSCEFSQSFANFQNQNSREISNFSRIFGIFGEKIFMNFREENFHEF